MAIKKIILHLGMTKTGSSSIQKTLFNNANSLKKNGYRYLVEWGENHLYSFNSLFSSYPVYPISTGNLGKPLARKKKCNQKLINKMLQVINTTDCEVLVLSGEYFHELHLDSTVENIKNFINKYFQSNGIETSIVYFVRNPLTWIISSLQQRVFGEGYFTKNEDYFDNRIKQYEGFVNLKKNFSECLILLKYEEACLDKDGLVGCFLKSVGFPEKRLTKIKICRENESRCMEVTELLFFFGIVEPLYPYGNTYRHVNPNRFPGDLRCLGGITGVKFDLPYQSKIELWERLQKTVHLLKEKTGIDYTGYKITITLNQETYTEETIQGFIKAFPKLSFVLQKYFLKFFEKKYMETSQVRFKQLYIKDSIPWKIYNTRSAFIRYHSSRIKNILSRVELLQSIKKFLKT